MNKKRLLTVILIASLSAVLLLGCTGGGSDADKTPTTDSNASYNDLSPEISVGSFTTEDLEGNAVTESILKEKEYTMINLWGTYCGPCIDEMPELEKIHQELPDNIQLIGIVCDFLYEVPEEAQASVREMADEIIESTGVTYPSLKIWADASWIYDSSNVVPTTYFVDSEGNLVSDIIFGADVDAYRKAIKKLSK